LAPAGDDVAMHLPGANGFIRGDQASAYDRPWMVRV